MITDQSVLFAIKVAKSNKLLLTFKLNKTMASINLVHELNETLKHNS
jgi:hypothetical protein